MSSLHFWDSNLNWNSWNSPTFLTFRSDGRMASVPSMWGAANPMALDWTLHRLHMFHETLRHSKEQRSGRVTNLWASHSLCLFRCPRHSFSLSETVWVWYWLGIRVQLVSGTFELLEGWWSVCPLHFRYLVHPRFAHYAYHCGILWGICWDCASLNNQSSIIWAIGWTNQTLCIAISGILDEPIRFEHSRRNHELIPLASSSAVTWLQLCQMPRESGFDPHIDRGKGQEGRVPESLHCQSVTTNDSRPSLGLDDL